MLLDIFGIWNEEDEHHSCGEQKHHSNDNLVREFLPEVGENQTCKQADTGDEAESIGSGLSGEVLHGH